MTKTLPLTNTVSLTARLEAASPLPPPLPLSLLLSCLSLCLSDGHPKVFKSSSSPDGVHHAGTHRNTQVSVYHNAQCLLPRQQSQRVTPLAGRFGWRWLVVVVVAVEGGGGGGCGGGGGDANVLGWSQSVAPGPAPHWPMSSSDTKPSESTSYGALAAGRSDAPPLLTQLQQE